MKIKVCGMRDAGNIRDLVELAPDYIGFIFYPKSKRFVEEIGEDVHSAIENTKKTGVFVDASTTEIKEKIRLFGLDAVQLHGNESAAMCEELKDESVELIKAFGVDKSFDFTILDSYSSSVDYFLFDTKTDLHGGSGKVFDWDILKNYSLDVPYFLSGGLDEENLRQVKQMIDKRLYAVDLNSKFETEPGLKDIQRLKKAFDLIRD